jgi:hypothetical protein
VRNFKNKNGAGDPVWKFCGIQEVIATNRFWPIKNRDCRKWSRGHKAIIMVDIPVGQPLCLPQMVMQDNGPRGTYKGIAPQYLKIKGNIIYFVLLIQPFTHGFSL